MFKLLWFPMTSLLAPPSSVSHSVSSFFFASSSFFLEYFVSAIVYPSVPFYAVHVLSLSHLLRACSLTSVIPRTLSATCRWWPSCRVSGVLLPACRKMYGKSNAPGSTLVHLPSIIRQRQAVYQCFLCKAAANSIVPRKQCKNGGRACLCVRAYV